MDLISCSSCGIVIDKDKADFASESRMYTDEGTVDLNNFDWDGNEYSPFIECPVCSTKIFEDGIRCYE